MQKRRKRVSANTIRLAGHVCVSCLFAESVFPRNLRDDKKMYGREKELSEIRRQFLGDDDRLSSLSLAVEFCLLVIQSLLQYTSILLAMIKSSPI